MSDFTIHSIDNAPEKSQDVLARAKSRYGFVPNLVGAMSEAPEVADQYMAIGDALRRTSLSPTELHVVWFTVNTFHGCIYCMAAHTGIAKADQVAQEVIDTARAGGAYADPKLQALKSFAEAMVRDRGWVDADALAAFKAAGYSNQTVLEVILVIAHKTLSNYTNHVVETPVDPPFQKFAWQAGIAAE